MEKTILITGGTGFLGSNMVKRLVGAGWRVVVLKRSFSDMRRLREVAGEIECHDIDRRELGEIVREAGADVILHCATNYGRKESDPLRIVEANLLLPLRLLCLAEASEKAPAFINTDTILDKRVSAYSLSKQQFKEWLQRRAEGLVCINVALEHFYGPEDDPSKFVTFIIQHLLQEVEGIDLTKGEQRRDLVYIDDVVEAFMRILGAVWAMRAGYYEYEVGSETVLPIREFVELVKRVAGNTRTELRFGALPYRPNEVMDARAKTEALRALGWAPRTPLEEGVARTIAEERKRMRA